MLDSMADAVRNKLLSGGLITATHTRKDGLLVTTGYTLTAAGWHRVTLSDDDTVDYTPPNTPPAGDLESQQPAERAA